MTELLLHCEYATTPAQHLSVSGVSIQAIRVLGSKRCLRINVSSPFSANIRSMGITSELQPMGSPVNTLKSAASDEEWLWDLGRLGLPAGLIALTLL